LLSLVTVTCTMTNTYLQANADADGDGLSNTQEVNGIDGNNDGRIDFVIPQADPLHKNLYVEVDYMNDHRPIDGVIQDVTDAFANAPVTNPDGITGVNLFVQLDENITHQATTSESNLDNIIKPRWFGTAAERADPNSVNLLAAKRIAFHYGLFAHSQPGTTSTGIGNLPGMNFLLSFGAGWAPDPVTGHNVGTRSEQAFTFMHELGHNMNLFHGGNDNIHCKPNYISVMNYLFSLGQYVANNTLDFSRSNLSALNENNLTERDGVSLSDPASLITIRGPTSAGPPPQGPTRTHTGIPIDWNYNGRIDDRNVVSDINAELVCRSNQRGEILKGFDDWKNVRYISHPPQESTQFLTPFQIAQEVPDMPTLEEVRESRVVLLTGINNDILRLEASAPEHPEFNTTQIAQLLRTDQLDAAIVELTKLQTRVIEVFGKEAANKEVVPDIQNLIGVLENQGASPSAAACSHQESDTRGCPNPLEVRSSQEIDKRTD
jgi:hypothetical protein